MRSHQSHSQQALAVQAALFRNWWVQTALLSYLQYCALFVSALLRTAAGRATNAHSRNSSHSINPPHRLLLPDLLRLLHCFQSQMILFSNTPWTPMHKMLHLTSQPAWTIESCVEESSLFHSPPATLHPPRYLYLASGASSCSPQTLPAHDGAFSSHTAV